MHWVMALNKMIRWLSSGIVLQQRVDMIWGKRNLGVCYYKGLCGLDVDYTEAVKWLRKAAEQRK